LVSARQCHRRASKSKCANKRFISITAKSPPHRNGQFDVYRYQSFEHIRSDNGPEITSKAVRSWLTQVGAKTLFIEQGSPWENGYCESFNGKLRDELLNGEIFYSLKEAQIVIEQWRKHYNTIRPHSALGYRPPAPQTFMPVTSHLDEILPMQ
jgi:putative transposase